MGKKKPKVKWKAVNSVPFNFSSDSGLVSQKQKYRGSDTFTANSTLPPRFERKTAQEKNLVYYDGQFCETEELPNGFIKVRSKHLDVLFKRDFYTKKIARIFNSGANPPLNSTLSETKEEMVPYNCHNSSDGSIIYNIDHLLVSSNFSFEGSATATANPSGNVSLENEDNVDNIRMGVINVIEDPHPQEIEDSEEPGFVDNPEDRVRHDSGFVDSSMNLPPDNSLTEPPVENLFLPSTPSVYVYIPSKNSLIPCKEVLVSPPTPRDPRCTCAPATSIFLTGQDQGSSEHLRVVHHAPPGFVQGPPPFWAGNAQHSFANGERFYPNMIPVDHHQHMMSCPPFGTNHSFNPYHVFPHLNPHVEPFAPVVEDFIVHPGDGNGPLSTSELANSSTEPNTYQLFPEDKKMHPLFEYSCSTTAPDGFQGFAQEGQYVSPRKVIEPDYDWMAQQEDSFKEFEWRNVVKSAPCNMESSFKQEVFIPHPLKSSIPGLPVESHTSKKAQKKKRRKKRKGSNEKKNVYSSDETVGGVEPQPHSSLDHKIQGCTFQSSSDMDSDKLESLFEARSMEQSHEVELSDALASSLVDPLAQLNSNDVEKESIQEVHVDSMADLILDVVDINDVNEILKNKSEQVVSKKNKKDQNPPQEKVLMPVVGCAITATDEMGHIVEEVIIAALKHSNEEREDQDNEDFGENKMSSVLSIEKDSLCIIAMNSRKQVKAFKDDSLKIVEIIEAKENIQVKLLDPSRSNQVKNNGNIKPKDLLSSSNEVNKKANKSKNTGAQADGIPLVGKRNKKYRKRDMSKSEPVHRVMINDSELEMLRPTQPFGRFSSVIVDTQRDNLEIVQQEVEQTSVKNEKPSQFERLEILDPKQNSSKISSLEDPEGPKENMQVEMLDAFKIKCKDSIITTSLSAETEVKKKTKTSNKGKSKIKETDQKKDFIFKEYKKADNEVGVKKQNLEGEKVNFSEKKNKKYGKKNKSKSEPVPKVMINDSEIQLIRSNRILRIEEVFSPEQIKKILQTTRFYDNIFVDNLGEGMERGWMALGRLPSSQMVPFQDQEADIGQVEPKDAKITKSLDQDEVDDIGLD